MKKAWHVPAYFFSGKVNTNTRVKIKSEIRALWVHSFVNISRVFTFANGDKPKQKVDSVPLPPAMYVINHNCSAQPEKNEPFFSI